MLSRRHPHHLSIFQRHRIDLRPRIVLPPIHPPLHRTDNQNDPERHDAIVHVVRRHRQLGREEEQYRGDEHVGDADQVDRPAYQRRELEPAIFWQAVAAAQAVDQGRDGVGDAECDDRRGDDGVEGGGGAEEDAAENYHQASCEVEGVKGEVEARVHAGEEAGEGEAAVAVGKIFELVRII